MRARATALAMLASLPGASLPAAPPREAIAAIDPPPTGRRAELATAQAMLARVLAAIQAVERQAALSGQEPTDDLLHVRAALAGMLTEARARVVLARRHISLVGGGDATGRPVTPTRRTRIYRQPVDGRIVIGFGAMSDVGIRSRGLTFVVPAGARVVAPAGGIVRYAQVFRGYGGTVIVDHGAGWNSLLTGLATLAVAPGGGVRRGAMLGTAGRGAAPRITLELRRRGRPVNAAAMIG